MIEAPIPTPAASTLETLAADLRSLTQRVAALETAHASDTRDLRRQLAELRGLRNSAPRSRGLRQIAGAPIESFTSASAQERERRVESIGREKVTAAVRRLYPNLDERSFSWPTAVDRVVALLAPEPATADEEGRDA
jgi:hypothetical protein